MLAQLNDELKFQHTALNLRGYRQQLISSNIANADTPHYKAKDIDFGSALQKSLANGLPGSSTRMSMSTTSSRHIEGFGTATDNSSLVKFRGEYQSSVDGNTVNMDTERAAFAENSLQYQASLQFITGTLKGLQTAITGQ